jgi:hypothetical protein
MAQTPPSRIGDMEYLLRSEAWLGSENAAGLQVMPDSLRLSVVEAYLHKGNGAFVNYYESDNYTEVGARTESYFRLNPRVVFYGKVHYGNFTGRNMGGSAWINPYDMPFDIVESVDTTRGTKNMEHYRLTGAISVRLWRGLSLGGRINYHAANYAKTRDLRHVNKRSDLSFSVGARYAFGNVVEVGADYFYRHRAEDIVFDIYGNTGQLYFSLISFGGFFGRTDQFDDMGSGYTIGSHPLFDQYHGTAVQARWRFGARWKLFVEAAGKWHNGEYGTRGTSNIVFTEHKGAEYVLHSTLSYRRDAVQHLLKASYRQEQLKNFENVYDYDYTSGNRSEIVYYGQNIVRDATQRQAQLTYTGYFGITDYRPAWRVEAGADYMQQAQTVSQYPYYRKQRLHRYNVFLHAGRTVERRANEFGVALGGAYGNGGGEPKDDGLYAPPSSTQKPPKNFDGYLYHEFDYLTAARVAGQAEASYARRFRAGLRASVTLRYELTHALQPVRLPGSAFHFVSLSLGCTF